MQIVLDSGSYKVELVAGPGFEPGMLRAYETGVVASLPA